MQCAWTWVAAGGAWAGSGLLPGPNSHAIKVNIFTVKVLMVKNIVNSLRVAAGPHRWGLHLYVIPR